MGTDIDLYVEKRKPNGEWDLLFPSTDMAEQLHGEWGKDKAYGPDNLSGWAWYSGRNYELFALLADVRNRFDVESPWCHRGLSPNFTVTDTHGHSHSYVTLAELKAYDWSTGVPISGWVGVGEYREFKENGSPHSYSQGVGGGNVVHVTNEEMDALFDNDTIVHRLSPIDGDPDRMVWVSTDGNAYFTKVEWTKPMENACGWFVNKTIPALEEFTKGTDPADIRLTYWFDC
jgi:hypothetical protein